ncbi:MAG: calcium-translocating P-type ATPase, PMCA-type, partial [Tissierellales bacterium]|nr:calcium-translocating P-type ATPase, PMCA-type [Tissierellales bacterium]
MHGKNIQVLLKELESNSQFGLTTQESENRLSLYGKNALKEEKSKSFLNLFLDQFKSILIMILIAAALLSAYIGEFTEGIVIMIIVILNALVGAAQEKSAGNAVKALKSMVSPLARVIRDQTLKEIPSELLVPGDIIELESGNLVPADIRLIQSINLKIDESALTGESTPVEKNAESEIESNAPLSERSNSAYLGTTVTYGRATGVVVKTGMHTEIGHIASMLEGEDEATPLQNKLNVLGSKLGIFCLAVCVIIFMLGYFRGMPLLEIFMVSVSLAVAAVPEGLPAIVTVILALGMKKMVSRHVLVKNLSSVETLGSTTVICSDKTGTLTQNKMTVTKIFDGQNEYSVSGSGYNRDGAIEGDFNKENLEQMMLAAILCNDASLTEDGGILGDPTEAALLVMAEKAGYNTKKTTEKYPRLQEYPFDSERKMMSTMHKIDGQPMVFSKGSPDSILKVCDRIKIKDNILPIEPYSEIINQIYMKWASSALRVLCYAGRQASPNADVNHEESHMILLGMSAMIDPERPEAKKSIKTCHDAGIRVIMITGDHGVTASAIGKNIGLLSGEEKAISGSQIDQMDEAEFISVLKDADVFSRVSPQHKVRIVEALKKTGNIVAMTGDGVNDAPSLKKADIGIAMGITGTDVSKEASDMILTDDNFASIVGAVEEGRVIYSNIRKFVSFLISCNIGEILLIFVSMLMGWGSPLRPIQLLWVNLITDSLPAFALGMEPEEDDVMKAAPRNPTDPIIDKKMGISIVFQAVGLSVAALISYRIGYAIHPDFANTFAFITLISGELLRSFSGRSETKSVFKTGFWGNKYLNLAVIGSYLLTLAILTLPFM